MEAYLFEPSKHLKIIHRWLRKRHLPLSLAYELPKLGLIVSHENIPIASLFLRRLENCSYAMVDSLLTDPDQPAALRDAAIDLGVEALIAKAKLHEISKLMATTIDAHTLVRSLKHGFQKISTEVIALDLL